VVQNISYINKEVTLIDVVTAEIVREYLKTVAGEMDQSMTRAAMSPVFNEGHDYSVPIFYIDGEKVQLTNFSGILNHSMPSTISVTNVVKYYKDDINEGDVFLVNDPYSGGSHLPDWTIMRPVFCQDRLTFFAVVRAHQLDVGGPVAGAKNAYAREIWQEGFRIFPIRVYDRGKLRQDAWDFFMANTRIRELMENDVIAMIGACKVGETRIKALLDKYEFDTVTKSINYILDYSERLLRSEFSRWPDGEYEGESFVDSDWAGTEDIKIKAKIIVKGDEVTVDFTGSDRQVAGCVNSPVGNTLSYIYQCFQVVRPDIPVNAGFFRAIKATLPERSVVDCEPPAPVANCTVCVGNNITETVMNGLEKIVPERVGNAGIDLCFIYTWGVDSRHGWYYLGLDYNASCMSCGGAYGVDGWGGHNALLSVLRDPSFEMFEIQFPFLYLQGEYVTDTAAPGKWRGVPAFHLKRETQEDATVNMFIQGYKYPLLGFVGGKPGLGNYFILDYGTKNEKMVTSFEDQAPSPKGQIILAQSGGGGGWGNPLDRDPRKVLDDVTNEYVSVEGARKDYGVVIDKGTMTIDENATRESRKALRS
jgi:N-methylhydantoinase B